MLAVVNKKIDYCARRAKYLNLISKCEKKIQSHADIVELETVHLTEEGQDFIISSMNIRIHPRAKLSKLGIKNKWTKGLRFCPEDFCFNNFELNANCPLNRAVYETFHKVVKEPVILIFESFNILQFL